VSQEGTGQAGGSVRMINVADKPVVRRTARATATVRMAPQAAAMAAAGELPKGDMGAVAAVAGTLAAKRTPDLLALCHPLALDAVDVEVDIDPDGGLVRIEARATAQARTGVEMEALTAAAVAALNVYDLVKGTDPAVFIEDVRLLEKTKEEPPA